MNRITRSLLVGVSQYENATTAHARSGGLTKAHLPSAALDVEAIGKLLQGLGVGSNEIATLQGATATRRDAVLRALARLAEGANREHQLVFYFSGHAMLLPRLDDRGQPELEEILCPSDCDWASRDSGITFDDFMRAVGGALRNGACIEVILEACSATSFDIKGQWAVPTARQIAPVQRFGCHFAGEGFPSRSGAVWHASLVQQSSHSGPVEPCKPGALHGLFTHFFCGGFAGRTRAELLEYVTVKLATYRKNRNACRCEDKMAEQEPSLSIGTGATGIKKITVSARTSSGMPLSGDCTPETVRSNATPSCGAPFVYDPEMGIVREPVRRSGDLR